MKPSNSSLTTLMVISNHHHPLRRGTLHPASTNYTGDFIMQTARTFPKTPERTISPPPRNTEETSEETKIKEDHLSQALNFHIKNYMNIENMSIRDIKVMNGLLTGLRIHNREYRLNEKTSDVILSIRGTDTLSGAWFGKTIAYLLALKYEALDPPHPTPPEDTAPDTDDDDIEIPF